MIVSPCEPEMLPCGKDQRKSSGDRRKRKPVHFKERRME